jgi:hypothetical protein
MGKTKGGASMGWAERVNKNPDKGKAKEPAPANSKAKITEDYCANGDIDMLLPMIMLPLMARRKRRKP